MNKLNSNVPKYCTLSELVKYITKILAAPLRRLWNVLATHSCCQPCKMKMGKLYVQSPA